MVKLKSTFDATISNCSNVLQLYICDFRNKSIAPLAFVSNHKCNVFKGNYTPFYYLIYSFISFTSLRIIFMVVLIC